MAALANSMVMLIKLRLLRVQLVPVKVVPIADTAVAPQVERISISFCLIQVVSPFSGIPYAFNCAKVNLGKHWVWL